MDILKMPPHDVCCELDRVCAPFYFTYTGKYAEEIRSIHVYPPVRKNMGYEQLAVFIVNEDNPLEYVLTKIILQFSGGAS